MKQSMGVEFEKFEDREPLDNLITFRIEEKSLSIMESDMELRFAIAYHLDCCPVEDKPEPFKPDPRELEIMIAAETPGLFPEDMLNPANFRLS